MCCRLPANKDVSGAWHSTSTSAIHSTHPPRQTAARARCPLPLPGCPLGIGFRGRGGIWRVFFNVLSLLIPA
jgi:hypothetical protein